MTTENENDLSERIETLTEERRILEEKLDESIMRERRSRERAEALVLMNAECIQARAEGRQRIGHLTGRLMDAAVLLNRHVRRPDFELVQQSREFVELIRRDTEGYTMTGPCDIPLLYAKIDLLKEDGTPMRTNEACKHEGFSHTQNVDCPLPAPESGVGFEMPTRPATDGTQVQVHPEFARVYDEAPGLWQGTIDAAAADAKRLGIDPSDWSEEDKIRLMREAFERPIDPGPIDLQPASTGRSPTGLMDENAIEEGMRENGELPDYSDDFEVEP